MDLEFKSFRWPHRLALVTAVVTFVLILLGGIVHNTGSSLACPDWPTCYGTFFPQMQGGILLEHSHRILGAVVGLLSILLCISLWRLGQAWRRLGVLAVILVIFQGVLGGLTVIYRLPPAISTTHLGTAMLFLALLSAIAFFSSEWVQGKKEKLLATTPRWLWAYVLCVLILLYLQVLLGAWVRHLGAGVACLDFPFCSAEQPWGESFYQHLHMLHRAWGLMVAIAVWVGLFLILFRNTLAPVMKVLVCFAALLVLAQIALGVWSVTAYLAILPVTAHLAFAALLWLSWFLLFLWAGVSRR